MNIEELAKVAHGADWLGSGNHDAALNHAVYVSIARAVAVKVLEEARERVDVATDSKLGSNAITALLKELSK